LFHVFDASADFGVPRGFRVRIGLCFEALQQPGGEFAPVLRGELKECG
jgi:hypothetical protein